MRNETNGVHVGGIDDGALARAFNAGSDARIAGLPVRACPFIGAGHEATYWRAGYDDVSDHWGHWARWPVKRLPRVDYSDWGSE